ncbi:MAG: M15 family metallopeptidase [Clostridia bacterium]|nr:M15 family metallopeptidase [Clostridia bacterium]
MAKDRRGKRGRHAKKKKFPFLYLGLLIAMAAMIVAMVAVIRFLLPDDSPDPEPDDETSTSTVWRGETTTASMALTDPTASTSDATTTTTTETTTTTTAVSSEYPVDGTWNLKLVNKWHSMTQAESELLPIVTLSGSEACDSRVKKPLQDMLAAASSYGLYVTSSYRSYATQERLYENKVGRVKAAYPSLTDQEARDLAATEVARPGTSEHNTGLAFDFLYSGMYSLEQDWENGEVFDWLMEHCHEYGFILRFPKGKEEITGVIYEPWHYRYVGVEAATEIMSRGITLEEYVKEKGLY